MQSTRTHIEKGQRWHLLARSEPADEDSDSDHKEKYFEVTDRHKQLKQAIVDIALSVAKRDPMMLHLSRAILQDLVDRGFSLPPLPRVFASLLLAQSLPCIISCCPPVPLSVCSLLSQCLCGGGWLVGSFVLGWLFASLADAGAFPPLQKMDNTQSNVFAQIQALMQTFPYHCTRVCLTAVDRCNQKTN